MVDLVALKAANEKLRLIQERLKEPHDASAAYQAAAVRYFGEFAREA